MSNGEHSRRSLPRRSHCGRGSRRRRPPKRSPSPSQEKGEKDLIFFKLLSSISYLSKHLLRWHVKGKRTKVHLGVVLNARQNEEDARALGAPVK